MKLLSILNNIEHNIKNKYTLYSCKSLLKNYTENYIQPFHNIPNNNYGYKKIPLYFSNHISAYIIKWDSLSKSPLHAHPNNGCLMKVLQNSIHEIKIDSDRVISSLTHNENDITYIEGSTIQHVMMNETQYPTTTLHIYAND